LATGRSRDRNAHQLLLCTPRTGRHDHAKGQYGGHQPITTIRRRVSLIDDLEMRDIFEDEDEEEGDGVTDLISAVVELLGRDMSRLVVEVREALEPVEPWDEG